jgi:LuxR family maltose regulon positive regulatory protein
MRPSELIDRPQLLKRAAELRDSRLTIVQAPAGYGKSSLLLQWFYALQAEGACTAWVTLDAPDRDPLTFLSYVTEALDLAGHKVDERIRSLIGRERYVSTDVLTTELANSLLKSKTPVFLFLDDAHYLIGTHAVECLKALIERAPPQLHVVVSSRETLDIPVARLRAQGQLTELGIGELRFANQEIAEFMAKMGHEDLDSTAIATLEARTEGWIVGVKLASMTLKWDPQRDRLENFSGERRQVTDFFAEDVLKRQPADMQDFLLRTSVLDRLCPALCDAVTQLGGAREFLDRCERSGLFLISLDAERTWYRYHPLFAEFLRRRLVELYPCEQLILHCRASEWLMEQGSHIEALEQALKGRDPVRAAKILDARCDAMAGAGQDRLIVHFAEQIPPQIQAFYPRIMLAVAWELIVAWQFDDARALLAASRTRFEEMRAEGSLSEREVRGLEHLLVHREMMLAQFQDDMPTAERLCHTLIKDFSDAHPYLKMSLYTSLINILRAQYKLTDFERLDSIAREHLTRLGSPHTFVHEAVSGPTQFMAGRSEAAIHCLEEGLASAVRIAGVGSGLGGVSALPLAEVYYERNDIERAAELIDKYLESGSYFGYVDQLIGGWLTSARLQRQRGDNTAALRTLDRANAIAARHGFERMRLWVGAERIKLLLRMSRPEEATQVAKDLGIPRDGESLVPASRVSGQHEARALAWLRLAQSQNRIPEAIKIAKQWRSFFANVRAVRNMIRWDVLVAGLMFLDGQYRPAQRALRQTLSVAAPGRFMRSFLDEGPLIGTLLLEQFSNASPATDATDRFAAELAAIFEQEMGRPVGSSQYPEPDALRLGGAVSAREMEILTMVGSGMLNREIGEKLGMTEGSVKWYLQQIYNKIGVRRRSQAVERARQFGLIN